MTSRRTFLSTALTLAALPVLTNGQTCCAAAKDEKKAACNADASNLKATGASIVECNEKKTKIKIKCAKCGYQAEIEIDTPTADKPYSIEWKCPKCGNKQKVTVEVAAK